MDFSKLFHQSSKDTGGHGTVHIPKDTSTWPKIWKETEYKTYPSLPHITLPETEPNVVSAAIGQRKSTRNYAPIGVGLEALSTLLQFSCGEIGGTLGEAQQRRAQPSGGSRFPLEAYLFIFRATPGLPAGVYHYAVATHELERLWEHPFTQSEIHALYSYPWVADAAGVLVLTAIFDRSQRKYRERGYRYILLEAGHVGQNIYLLAPSLGLGCCSVTGSRDEQIEQLLNIDGETESLLYSVCFGVPKV
jgi:SagB-type dehydrogenase family enzyme